MSSKVLTGKPLREARRVFSLQFLVPGFSCPDLRLLSLVSIFWIVVFRSHWKLHFLVFSCGSLIDPAFGECSNLSASVFLRKKLGFVARAGVRG